MKTVKVRIAVAVDPKGRWCTHGNGELEAGLLYPKNHDELLETIDLDQCGPSEALFWLTAELPIPEPVEVAAKTEVQA